MGRQLSKQVGSTGGRWGLEVHIWRFPAADGLAGDSGGPEKVPGARQRSCRRRKREVEGSLKEPCRLKQATPDRLPHTPLSLPSN